MSRSGMLRTRRKDVNIKPNRRLDRKSSRGMIYENEELRLRTININAEIERGQSDIKKLRRENEQLRKEIWCLRDEYDKLDKLLKDKEHGDTSCSSCTSDSESCSSATESSENETTQNLENVQKTNLHHLRSEFDHLSVVTEETSAECSDKNSNPTSSIPKETTWNILPPDESYPNNCQTLCVGTSGNAVLPKPKHFFAPLKCSAYENCNGFGSNSGWGTRGITNGTKAKNFDNDNLQTCEKTSSDLIVKTDTEFPNFSQESQGSTNSFVNGGNLEELLQDIQTISNDILQISGDINKTKDDTEEDDQNKPYKTELSVVLMPKPMALLGFEKYEELKASIENLKKSTENMENLELRVPENLAKINENNCVTPFRNEFVPVPVLESPMPMPSEGSNPFYYTNLENYQNSEQYNSDSYDNYGYRSDCIEKANKLNEIEEKCHNEMNINHENVEKSKKPSSSVDPSERDGKEEKKDIEKSPKMRKTRKVSIYFKGKKDKLARSLSLDTPKKGEDSPKLNHSPIPIKKDLEDKAMLQKTESKLSIFEPSKSDDKIINSDAKTSTDSKNSYDRKHRKSSSTSPERKHLHGKHEEGKKGHKRRHKKSERLMTLKRNSVSLDRQRDRSFSVCTDRSHILDHRFGHFDDFTNSERERTNSISSCDTVKSRKNSVPTFQVGGKIPWFGCWGNGCI